MCLVREDEKSPYQVLSPCGTCRERLRYWGIDVQVAVTTEEEKIKFDEVKSEKYDKILHTKNTYE